MLYFVVVALQDRSGPLVDPPLVVIAGPTAIGKTAVAIALAQRLGGHAEIVSADSMQVYRKMDIGTAKPTRQQQTLVPFKLIDVNDPDEDFSVHDYQGLASSTIAQIRGRGKVPIVCGGTGLYIRAVTTRLDIPGASPDPDLRARWAQYAADRGQAALLEELLRVDPASARRLHENDSRRIIRALEVYEKTGRPLSAWHDDNARTSNHDMPPMDLFGLTRDRVRLYEAIDLRVDQMMRDGLIDEVRRLRAQGYSPTLKSMKALGYAQINAHIEGQASCIDAVADIKAQTHHYARRQLIWFRGDKRLSWINCDDRRPESIADEIVRNLSASALVHLKDKLA